MRKHWRISPHDSARIAAFERAAGVSPTVAQLLLARGVCRPEDAAVFLDAKLAGLRDPESLPGLAEAADRLFAATRAGRRVVIYGDYDVDGMTAVAILHQCLRLLGGNVGYFIPNRLEDGYGLNHEALRDLAERGASLVVTVDCGAASVAEAETARALGLELIITDHHEFGPEPPRAAAIVHPRLPGSNYPFAGLCGAGVAFKLAWAVCQRASDAKRVSPRLRDFLVAAMGLAALGAVADVVPLLDENRLLVKHGLVSLHDRPLVGVKALLEVAKLGDKSSLSSEDLAFSAAPRLNAVGRLEQATLGVELLITDDPARAAELAKYIDQLNRNRDSLERSILTSAGKQIKEKFPPADNAALVLAGRDWHPGVIGVVASRLAEKHHRPVVLLALDKAGVKPASGSARSAGGLNLHEALRACAEHLATFGGHAAAAGLKIAEDRVDAFRQAFVAYAARAIPPADREPTLAIDAETTFAQLTLGTLEQIERLAPFGHGNPRPVLCASDVRLAEAPKKIGNERHLSVKLAQHNLALRAVAFGHAEWADEMTASDAAMDVAFRPVINEFRGYRKVELQLVDWRPGRT